MGAAVWKAADGQTADGGAPYNWDEAAAFHIGRKDLDLSLYSIGGTVTPGILYSPWEFNWKRDADFPDGVKTHAHAPPIFNHGLVNLRGNSYDPIAVEAAQNDMYKIYAITAIRSAIKYGWKAYGGGTFSDKYLAEGALYWRSASGYLSTFDKTTVQEIDAIFDLSRTTFTEQDACNVKTKVESLYLAAGISCAEVGTWKDVVADTCLDTACTPSGNDTLSDGSTDYVAGCVADAGETTTAEPGATTAQEVSQALTAHLSGAFLVAVAAIFA
jgi:hypothetical protein